jgi:hypothetical protein
MSTETADETVPMTLTPAETALGYQLIPQRDVDEMFQAVKTLGARTLPDGKAYGHLGRCVAALRPHATAGNDAREMVQKAHYPKIESGSEGDEIKVLDPIGMQNKIGEINRQLCKVQLPGKITDAMLPKKLKSTDDNEKGVANCLGALVPWLYEFDDDEAN